MIGESFTPLDWCNQAHTFDLVSKLFGSVIYVIFIHVVTFTHKLPHNFPDDIWNIKKRHKYANSIKLAFDFFFNAYWKNKKASPNERERKNRGFKLARGIFTFWVSREELYLNVSSEPMSYLGPLVCSICPCFIKYAISFQTTWSSYLCQIQHFWVVGPLVWIRLQRMITYFFLSTWEWCYLSNWHYIRWIFGWIIAFY